MLPVEEVEQLAARLVEPLAHRPVPGHVQRGGFIAVLGQQAFGRIVRLVREHGRIPDEEGPVAGPVDEIEHRLHPRSADLQALVAVPATAGGIAVGHPLGEATPAEVTFPPLARLKAHVTLLAQQSRQRGGRLDPRDLPAPLGQGLVAR
jgi:hypothetical protein